MAVSVGGGGVVHSHLIDGRTQAVEVANGDVRPHAQDKGVLLGERRTMAWRPPRGGGPV